MYLHKITHVLILLLPFHSACVEGNPPKAVVYEVKEQAKAVNLSDSTISTRFPAPEGCERAILDSTSFAYFLRHFPLKKQGTPVRYFDGSPKQPSYHAAVLDIDTGKKDLQQCADAIMRLRAEWLYSQKRYDEIGFHFVNGFDARYAKWRTGNRIYIQGNKATWIKKQKPSTDYASFRQYMDIVFMYASTLSLSEELLSKPIQDVKIGDVLIQGGAPGHAVIVVDMVQDSSTSQKYVLLAQSYMPAQDIHILNNPSATQKSPWYPIEKDMDVFNTPEWSFSPTDLKAF